MHVAGRLAVDGDDLVAHGQPGPRGRRSGRDGDDPGQRTWRPGYGAGARACPVAWRLGTLPDAPSTRCCSPRPAGFCAGVEMAIKALAWMVRAFEPPVYCYHEIVHNQLVVDRFRATSAWCSSTTSPRCPRAARSCCRPTARRPRSWPRPGRAGGYVVDAVCPLVTKVHHEVKVPGRQGLPIVYVGHEGHEEAVGTMAVAPDAIDLVETVADVDALPDLDAARSPCWPRPRCRHRDWAGVADAARDRFPDLWMPGPQRPVLRHHQPPVGADGDRRRAATPSSSSARPTRPTPGPSSSWPARRAAPGCSGSTAPTSCPTTSPAPSASPPAPRPPRSWSTRSSPASAPADGRRGGRASPTRTSTSRRPASCATCSPPSTCWPRSALGGSVPDRPAPDDRALARQRRPHDARLTSSPYAAPAGAPGPERRGRRCQDRRRAAPRRSTPSASSLHVLAATVWVGGQFVARGPAARPRAALGDDAPRTVARGVQPHRLAGVRRAGRDGDLEPRRAPRRRLRHRVAGHPVREDPGGGGGTACRPRSTPACASRPLAAPRPAPSGGLALASRRSCWAIMLHG